MRVSSSTPTKTIVDTILGGNFIISSDYGPHLMHWSLAARSALTAVGIVPSHTAATLRDEQRNAKQIREHLRRICIEPDAWIGKFGADMVRWININMDPPDDKPSLVPFHDARDRALSYPELLAFESSKEIHARGIRPLPHLSALFPYHQVYCPRPTDAKLYVSLFKWLSTTVRRERCWTVLDWHSQSGIISRSLLSHGVKNLVCVDSTARGLKTTKESIVKEIGLTQYTKMEQSNAIQFIQHAPMKGVDQTQRIAKPRLEAKTIPASMRGMKFDIVVTHVPMPLATITPYTDIQTHMHRIDASQIETMHQFLDLCESTLLRCAGRYVAIITHNYHTLVEGEPSLHPLPEPTNWELIHRDRCALGESPEILGACGEHLRENGNAFFLHTQKQSANTAMWMETYLRDATAYLWIFRLKGVRKAQSEKTEKAAEETSQKIPWKESGDYNLYQPRDGPLLAMQLAQLQSFSFLEEVKKAEAAAPKMGSDAAPAQKAEDQQDVQPKRRNRQYRHFRRQLSDKEIAKQQLQHIDEQIEFLNSLARK